MCQLFLGVTLLALVSYDTHDMNLPAAVVQGVAHGFSVDGQTVIDDGKLLIPLPESPIQLDWCYSNQDVTDGTFAGDALFSVAVVAAKTFSGFWREGLRPIGNCLVAAHAAEHGAGGNGQDDMNRVFSSLGPTRIGDCFETPWKRAHLFGGKFHSRSSLYILLREGRPGKQPATVTLQELYEDQFRNLPGVAVALTSSLVSFGDADR